MVRVISTARALIFNQKGELLLVKNSQNSPWFTPGGWVDGFETLEEACIREVYEETSLKITVHKLYKIDYYKQTAEENIKWKENVNKIEHYFICTIISGELKTDKNNKNLWEDHDAGNTAFIKFFTKEQAVKENIVPLWLKDIFDKSIKPFI